MPAPATTEAGLAALRATLDERRNEIKRAQRSEGEAWNRVKELESVVGRLAAIKPGDQRVPPWLRPKKRASKHIATPVLLLSDLHLDEKVNLREMEGLNEYNREIAEQRLERVVNKTAEYLKSYVAGVGIDGIVVPLMGDIISGGIHEELAKTNESPTPATIVHWVPRLASALTYLADEFGRVFVPTVEGNHDRTGKKIQYKNRVEESFAWIIYNWLADTLRNDPRITFSISQSPENRINVYGTEFLISHGDSTRGGGGIGGIFPPIMRWVHKKQSSYSSQRRPFDYALMGHWHQLVYGQNFIINGSLKGYDEYARGFAFSFERPQQALFLVTPENGITTRTSIYAN